MKAFVLSISISLGTFYSFGQSAIPASELGKHINDSVTTSDKIFGGRIIEHNQTTILYLGGQFPEQTFTVQIKEPARSLLKLKHPDELKGHKITVTGKIRDLGGKPSILIFDPKQIQME